MALVPGMSFADQADRLAVEHICLAKPVQNGLLRFDAGSAPISLAGPRQSVMDPSLFLQDQAVLQADASVSLLTRATEDTCAG